MSNLVDIESVRPIHVWGEVVRARRIEGERVTLALVELAPDAHVPEHRHAAEQLGMVIQGSVQFRIDDEVRELGPGGTWRIVGEHPHEVHAGPAGAVVIDVFNPVRDDWNALPTSDARPAPWPANG